MLKATLGVQSELKSLEVAYGAKRFSEVANRHGILNRNEMIATLEDHLVNLDNVMYNRFQLGEEADTIEAKGYENASFTEDKILYVNQSHNAYFDVTNPEEPIMESVVEAVTRGLK